MDAVDLILEDAVNNGIIAGCECVAVDRDGIFKYTKAAGVSSATATSATPMSTRSVFSLISSTKIMTVVAALQLVERGDLSLDQDVSPLLAFEPGESFGYGGGIDWVGELVERVSGEASLDDYMRKHIWKPLGIHGITCWLDEHPEVKSMAVETVQRTAEGGIEPSTAISLNEGVECFGGQGAYAHVDDFLKILHSLLADDGKLLKPETVAEMFKPQLTAPAKAYLNEMLRDPEKEKLVLGDFSKPATYDWNLAGLVAADDGVDGRRRRGATSWFGMLNFYWFVDVDAGLCGAFGTQSLPMGDRKVNDLVMEWQNGMYDGLSRAKQQKNC